MRQILAAGREDHFDFRMAVSRRFLAFRAEIIDRATDDFRRIGLAVNFRQNVFGDYASVQCGITEPRFEFLTYDKFHCVLYFIRLFLFLDS